MGRKSRTAVLKRQRELRKAEKAAKKRAKRHGVEVPGFTEPQPTASVSDLEEQPDVDPALGEEESS